MVHGAKDHKSSEHQYKPTIIITTSSSGPINKPLGREGDDIRGDQRVEIYTIVIKAVVLTQQ